MNSRHILLTIATLGATAACAPQQVANARTTSQRQATPPCGPGLAINNTAKDSRCFELRTYTVQAGSSADLLHKRFREHTIALFQRHGMTVIGFWQPVARLDQLVYILAYRNAAARDSAWGGFNTDPDWLRTRAEMKVSVDVDNTFMVATDYSPIK